MNKLAIVIPAYKIDFFERTLKSLAKQTCKDFTVYIGIDASPCDFFPMIDKYEEQLDIICHRFETNMGATDLVGQWNRCIDFTRGEEWLWLFSDDDELENNCVEQFYVTIKRNPNVALLHFNVSVIDCDGEYITDSKYVKRDFPNLISSKEYAKARLTYKLNSFVVEYIFKRELFEKLGRWQNFDLAWGSDDATWVKLGAKDGILTINDAKVRWRLSDYNITPKRSPETSLRKVKATVQYLDFLDDTFHDKAMEQLYYKYFIHAIYNAMKDCSWDNIKSVILLYRQKRKDIIPIWLWKVAFVIVLYINQRK